MSKWTMPNRLPTDGPMGVRRVGDDYLALDFNGHEVTVSRYNAARLYGMLGMFLEIPLSKAMGKAIKLTPPGVDLNMSVEFPEPKSLGERLAQSLLPDKIGSFTKVLEPVRCVHGTTPPEMCEHSGCHPFWSGK